MPEKDRRFLTMGEFVEEHFVTQTGPPGHGLIRDGQTWYSVTPVDGLRMIVLDSSIPAITVPTGIYFFGAVVFRQFQFLINELNRAEASDELVMIVTHHPSSDFLPIMGSELSTAAFHALLSRYPNVIAHLAGHSHRNRVWDRGGYVEFETSAIIDYPQQGRMIEIWRDGDDIELRYANFDHLYQGAPFDALADRGAADDAFLPMRRVANELSRQHAEAYFLLPPDLRAKAKERHIEPPQGRLGRPEDRDGVIRLRRKRVFD